MSELLQGFGVFLGVLAGTAVLLLTQSVTRRLAQNQKVKNLRFEFQLNVKKIDGWLDLLGAYRNAVNANAPDTFAAYFDLSRIVFVTANDMWATGLLYKYLTHDDIGKLQVLSADFTSFMENYLNNQIAQSRLAFNQAQAARDVNFWEKKFKDDRQTFIDILRRLG